MRRALSLVLLLVFGLPVVAPALGPSADSESGLPACCRRNGKHHCMMSAEQMQALLNGEHFTTVRSRCPFYPTAPVTMHHELLALPAPGGTLMNHRSPAEQLGQVMAWARAAQAGARHKRGPPIVRLS